MLVPRVPSVGGLEFPATIYPLENRVSSDSAAPTPFIFQTIDSIGEKELDSLPYGVIQLDAQGTVLRYNSYEEGLSGSPGRRLWERISLSRSRPVLTCRNSTDVSVRGAQPASCTALSATTSR